MKFTPLFIFALFVLDCSSPVSPIEPDLHGVWTATRKGVIQQFSFNTTNATYRQLLDYGHNFLNEYEETFVREPSRILFSEFAGIQEYRYSFSHDTIVISWDSLNVVPVQTRLVRTSNTPRNERWLEQVSWTNKRAVIGVPNWNPALGISDSGTFVLSEYSIDVLKLDTATSSVTYLPIDTTSALDAEGSFLWTATNTAIQKRTLPDLSVVQSIDIQGSIGTDTTTYQVTGMAVGANEIYIAARISPPKGILGRIYVFSKQGTLLQMSPPTFAAIKDLALAGNRLFAVTDKANFHEIDLTTGDAIRTFYVETFPSGGFFSAIAIFNNRIHLCYVYLLDVQLIETVIPSQ